MASKMNLTENGLLCHRWTPHSDKIPQYIFMHKTCILNIIIRNMFNFNIIYSDIYNIDHYVFGMDGSNGDYCGLTSADTKIDLIVIQCALKSENYKQP